MVHEYAYFYEYIWKSVYYTWYTFVATEHLHISDKTQAWKWEWVQCIA